MRCIVVGSHCFLWSHVESASGFLDRHRPRVDFVNSLAFIFWLGVVLVVLLVAHVVLPFGLVMFDHIGAFPLVDAFTLSFGGVVLCSTVP